MISEIMNVLDGIENGYLDEAGQNIMLDDARFEEEFDSFYHLQSPRELLKTKCGVCFDKVELERELFSKTNYKFYTYFICIKDINMLPCHTFLVYEDNSKYYWFEHSWGFYKGSHEYNSLNELLKDVSLKFIESHPEVVYNDNLYLYEYSKPEYNIDSCSFYNFIYSQKRIMMD